MPRPSARNAAAVTLAAIAAFAAASAGAAVETRPAGTLPTRGPLSADRPWVVVLPEAEAENRVFDMDGNLVAGPYAISRFAVPNPRPWTAETPTCYRLERTLQDGTVESEIFGFFTRRINGGRLLIDGRPVRVRFAPKELNGNAEFAARISPEDALLRGIYRIEGREACEIAHEVASATPEATFHRFRDWSAAPTNYFSRIVVRNGNAFSDSRGVTLRWTLLNDGLERDSGEFAIAGLGPGEETILEMPEAAARERFGGGTVSMRLDFSVDGRHVARDQFEIVESRDASPIYTPPGFFRRMAAFGAPRVSRSQDEDGTFSFDAGGTRLVFGRETMPSMFLSKGLFGATPLFSQMRLCSDILELDGRAPALPRPGVEERGGSVSFLERSRHRYGISAKPGIALDVRWTIYPNGIVAARGRIDRGNLEGRCGFALDIPCEPAGRTWRNAWLKHGSFGDGVQVEWFGLGPGDNSPGDGEGAFLGRWKRGVADPVRASATRGLAVRGLVVRTLAAPFSFALEPDPDAGKLVLSIYPDAGGGRRCAFGFAFSADGDLAALSPDDTFDIPSR